MVDEVNVMLTSLCREWHVKHFFRTFAQLYATSSMDVGHEKDRIALTLSSVALLAPNKDIITHRFGLFVTCDVKCVNWKSLL